MNCPKCNQPMKIMYRPDADYKDDFCEIVKVLGSCEDCDFDAIWTIETVYKDDEDLVKEYNLNRYFFG